MNREVREIRNHTLDVEERLSPDNSAMEGSFGRLKVEFFYGRDWKGWSIGRFMEALGEYIDWCNEKRIKVSLGGMSPAQYRMSLGLAA